MGGDAIEQLDEPAPFGGGERLGQLGLVGLYRSERGREHLTPGIGEDERMGAAIDGVGPPLHEAAGLQLVDERHEPARRDLEQTGDRLLGLALDGRHHPQQTEVPDLEVERCETVVERAAGREADLGDEETDTGSVPRDGRETGVRRVSGVRLPFHVSIVPNEIVPASMISPEVGPGRP